LFPLEAWRIDKCKNVGHHDIHKRDEDQKAEGRVKTGLLYDFPQGEKRIWKRGKIGG